MASDAETKELENNKSDNSETIPVPTSILIQIATAISSLNTRINYIELICAKHDNDVEILTKRIDILKELIELNAKKAQDK